MEKISIYPKGTFVELNTRETAQVVEQNIRMPSSPKVRIVYDQNGKKVDSGRVIDLSSEAEIYIAKTV